MEKAEKAQSHFLRARIRHGFSWCLVALFLFGVYTFLSLFRWMDWGVREKAYLLRQAFSGPQWESFYFPYGIEADAGAPARRASRGPPVLSAVFEVKISAARRYELRFLVPDDPAHRSDRGWVIACPLRPDAGGGGFIRDAANERTYSAAATLQQIHIDMLYYFSQNAPS
ncbi:MAG: hypothetical protein LBK75_00730 [Oscillospiraceae bacterium]|jgi:hypothetical protein|nr:hypothetical protein [Oscillospiraceae bacterium]